MNKVRPKDKKEVSDDLKRVFDNFDATSTIDDAKNKAKYFVEKWESSYTCFTLASDENALEYLFTYIKLPKEVIKLIYTTNSIGNLNKNVKKQEKINCYLRKKFVVIKNFEQSNWGEYPVSNYNPLGR